MRSDGAAGVAVAAPLPPAPLSGPQPGPYFLSKLAAELPVTAIFPILFGAIMYPMTGLQVRPIDGTTVTTQLAYCTWALALPHELRCRPFSAWP